MIAINDFIKEFYTTFPEQKDLLPWEITNNLLVILKGIVSGLGDGYKIVNGVGIHRSATVEQGAVLKEPAIISPNCFVGANAYLRGGVYLGDSVTVGPGCEIKTSLICSGSSIAHFNFIGDSIIGKHVNFEAGSIIANYHNDRKDKTIFVSYDSNIIDTGCQKFGALVGDQCKIGANAVLSPGTILTTGTIVNRLELIDQQKKLSR